jgi:hypothetical protein
MGQVITLKILFTLSVGSEKCTCSIRAICADMEWRVPKFTLAILDTAGDEEEDNLETRL